MDMPGGRTLRRLVWAASVVGVGFLIYAGWFVILKPPRSSTPTVFLIFWTGGLIFIAAKNTRDFWRAGVRDRAHTEEGLTPAHRDAANGDLRTNFQSLGGRGSI